MIGDINLFALNLTHSSLTSKVPTTLSYFNRSASTVRRILKTHNFSILTRLVNEFLTGNFYLVHQCVFSYL